MKTVFGKFYQFPSKMESNNNLKGFVVSVCSTYGKLNTKTGYVIELNELDRIIYEVIEDKLVNENDIFDVRGIKYLPNTLEIVASRLYDWIEERLPYDVKLLEIQILHSSDFFVRYRREDVQETLEPKPQLQPKSQRKFRKRRKK